MAILGRTGSGKTTIAELLLRMYDISSGEILIDGQDIRQLNLNSLRKQIGYVPQDVFLFSDSIEKNIAFSDAANITPENAAKSASVHNEILGFKEQYQTVVGERGITLSGGQKQRISIARAIIKNPSVIILDDCLSAVDTKTEKTILTNLKEVLNNKTSIVITHRISSMIDFDKVVVLDKGVVAEQGTHEDLMKLKRLYAEMYEKQHLDENILS
jgi:ATP-binding cassette subfamily B protein